MTNQYEGCCQCGEVTFTLNLPQALGNYAPRACDCDYCTTRHITYLSDPNGVLDITSQAPLTQETQGSEQATFLLCAQCRSMIAVSYESNMGVKGAVNASLLSEVDQLLPPVSASPKLLSSTDKVERWQSLWLTVSFS